MASVSALAPSYPRGDVLSIAPMMEYTDRHFRFLMRLLTRHTRLYTEMVVDSTLIHSPQAKGYLRFSPEEHPVACQLGGSAPVSLAAAARLVEEMGYDEVNLNCGCPSPKVAGKGCFGAALMLTPEVVRDCIAAMRSAVSIPVTVKCRLGVDKIDSYEAFREFISTVSSSGCQHFIIHARKCLLKGLDTKGNRTVPPLKYAWVQRIALEFPHIRFSLNGGIISWKQAEQLLALRKATLDAPLDTGNEKKDINLPLADNLSVDCKGCGACTDDNTDENSTEDDSKNGKDSDDTQLLSEMTLNVRRHKLLRAQQVQREEEAGKIGDSQIFKGTGDPNGGTGDSVSDPEGASLAIRGSIKPESFNPSMFGETGSVVLDSIMVGRAAYQNTWMFADADRRFFGQPNPGLSRREVIDRYLEYCDTVLSTIPEDERDMKMYGPFEFCRPLIGLFTGEYGGSKYRTQLCVLVQEDKVALRDAVREALKNIPDEIIDERMP